MGSHSALNHLGNTQQNLWAERGVAWLPCPPCPRIEGCEVRGTAGWGGAEGKKSRLLGGKTPQGAGLVENVLPAVSLVVAHLASPRAGAYGMPPIVFQRCHLLESQVVRDGLADTLPGREVPSTAPVAELSVGPPAGSRRMGRGLHHSTPLLPESSTQSTLAGRQTPPSY